MPGRAKHSIGVPAALGYLQHYFLLRSPQTLTCCFLFSPGLLYFPRAAHITPRAFSQLLTAPLQLSHGAQAVQLIPSLSITVTQLVWGCRLSWWHSLGLGKQQQPQEPFTSHLGP